MNDPEKSKLLSKLLQDIDPEKSNLLDDMERELNDVMSHPNPRARFAEIRKEAEAASAGKLSGLINCRSVAKMIRDIGRGCTKILSPNWSARKRRRSNF